MREFSFSDDGSVFDLIGILLLVSLTSLMDEFCGCGSTISVWKAPCVVCGVVCLFDCLIGLGGFLGTTCLYMNSCLRRVLLASNVAKASSRSLSIVDCEKLN